MKQVALRLRDGRVDVLDVPPPSLAPECVLVDVRASVLSVGTERSKIDAGRESLVGKARARPDQARQVLDKARRDGVRDTVTAVRTKLDQPTALGYSAAGVALEVGAHVRGICPGDRVACGGGELCRARRHRSVPGNLCVSLPDGVGFEAGRVRDHRQRRTARRASGGCASRRAGRGDRPRVGGAADGADLQRRGRHVMGIDLSPVAGGKGAQPRLDRHGLRAGGARLP